MIGISIEKKSCQEERERDLVKEIANDLSFSLKRLRTEQLRREAQDELTESEERLELALWSAGDGLWDWDLETEEAYYSDQWIKMLGFEVDEVERTIQTWENLVHPDHLERVKATMNSHLEGESPYYESEYKIETESGDYIWVKDRGKVVARGKNKEPLRMIGTIQNITERKKAEEKEEFLHSLLRHDLRNKIQISQGFLQLIENLEIPEKGREYLKKAMKANSDGMELIEKVRTLRMAGEKKVEEVNVQKAIENAISENRSQAEKNGFAIELNGKKVDVEGGPLLEELFSNLIKNSIQHSEGEKIEISIEENEDRCTVSVEDDGEGIPDEYKDEIFDRGSKRGKSAGSGLGVHLVKKIAESYGGGVEVKDSEMGGARFDVHLKKAGN